MAFLSKSRVGDGKKGCARYVTMTRLRVVEFVTRAMRHRAHAGVGSCAVFDSAE